MLTIKVIATGNSRSGTAKSGKPYWMCEAYAHLPGVPYPQKISYYAAAQNEVLPAGEYECDAVIGVKDQRITIDVDPRQGRRLAAVPTPLKTAQQ
jgi:hypothetical protein